MPWSYEIEPGIRLVISRFRGTVTDADVYGHDQSLQADPAFDPGYRQLVDLTEVSDVTVASTHIREAGLNPFFAAEPRRAIFAPGRAFGSAKMYEVYSALVGQNVSVFADRDEAIRWLGGTP